MNMTQKKYPFKEKFNNFTEKNLLILEEAINTLSRSSKLQAKNFINTYGIKTLAIILNAIHAWYRIWNYSRANVLKKNHEILKTFMDLKIPIGVYRGFKIPRKIYKNYNWNEGDVIWLDVKRNRGCASFTNSEAIANKFSGKSKTHVGLVIQLLGTSPEGIAVLAPRIKTKKWFNELYEKVIGPEFRNKEEEYVICAKKIKAKIIKIKK